MTDRKRDLINSIYMVAIGFAMMLLLNMIMCIFIRGNNFNIFEKIFTNDSYWYESIIESGYMQYSLGDPNNMVEVIKGREGMANWAFFPLLPAVIKVLRIVTFSKISVEFISFVFSTTCYIFFIYNIFRYLREKNVKINYHLLFLIFIFNSIIMFFYTLYTESLTMLLIILLIRSCDKEKFMLGGVLCAMLTGIKVQGCFWCIYLLVKIFQKLWIKSDKPLTSFFRTLWEILKNPYYVLSLAISPLGLFAFFVILNKYNLSPLVFMHVQSGWKKESSFFLYTIIKDTFFNLNVVGLLAIFFIGFTIYLLKKKKYLSASMMAMYIVSACSSSVASIGRYILGTVIFPIELYYLLLSDFEKVDSTLNIEDSKRERLRIKLFYGFKFLIVLPCIIIFFVTTKVPMY